MWMIYGANGYTGKLAAGYAKDHDLSPVVAGRHGERIRRLGDELGFESRVFDLADEAVAAKNLDGIAAVLHCAGPFLLGRAPVQAFLKGPIASRVQGPTDDQRARDEVYLYGEAWDDAGNKVAMRLRTREPYTLTAEAGVKATLRVIEDRLAPGTYTPSMAFGADYVLALDGVILTSAWTR